MRRAFLTGSWIGLLVALFAMWAYRFERSPGLPVWGLADLRENMPSVAGVEWTGTPDQPKLRLRVDAGDNPVAVRIGIPAAPAVEGLHLRFRMSSRGLIPGGETWQDGRFMIDWHHPQGSLAPVNTPIGSIELDQHGPLEEIVVRPARAPAVPTLRLEHLGRSGEFDLSDLDITAVRERAMWKTGRWFLAFGWLAWAAAWIRTWPGIQWWRAIAASAIWVLMGMQFVIPGPWGLQRPLIREFQLGGETATPSPDLRRPLTDVAETPPSAMASGPLAALGKLPDQGSLVLRVKQGIARARPLLHALLLFAPALAISFLVGRRPALLLTTVLAVSIELAQVGFGYGFDRADVLDLFNDAVGIALALWVYGKMTKRRIGVAL